MLPIYASTLHRRDRGWGVRRRGVLRLRSVLVLALAAGGGAVIERLLG
jgi:hypothetical protein